MTLFSHLPNHWDGSKQANLRNQKRHWGIVKTTNYSTKCICLGILKFW
jgi:hypothetical protein